MILPWRKKEPLMMEPLSLSDEPQVAAAVLVCDAFLVFESDTAVHRWAARIFQHISPDTRLAKGAKVEAIVGHKGNKNSAFTNMSELLQLMMDRAGLSTYQYQIEYFEIEVKRPPMKIWCVAAIRSTGRHVETKS